SIAFGRTLSHGFVVNYRLKTAAIPLDSQQL
ncbi:hypothetical protein Godav_005625, partial [Gossypium davidsonii]|nr:hypothetical protein [Gossypium davidsonii]